MTANEPPKAQKISREALYEQVWAKPLRTVAAEYGLSDVGLAKACDRLNIPRPPVGHWVRLEHGKKVEKPPLPPAAPGQPTMLLIKPAPAGTTRSKDPGVPKPEPPVVVVEDNLRKAHPAVRQLQQILRDRTPDEHGILIVHGPDGAIFRASKATKDRALRILDALFKALALRGHPVAIVGPRTRCVHKVRCLRMTSTTRDRKIRRDRFLTVPVSKVLPAYRQKEHACQYAERGISFWGEEAAKSCRACFARKPE